MKPYHVIFNVSKNRQEILVSMSPIMAENEQEAEAKAKTLLDAAFIDTVELLVSREIKGA